METPQSRLLFGLVPMYSVLIVAGILAAYGLGSREEKRLGLPRDTMIDLTLWSVPAGVVGARLYYVLFSLDQFRANPISALYIWEGGVAIYGAVIGGLAACVLLARRRKLPLASLLDMVAPGLLLAQAIGRWGNYFNMEAYGGLVVNPAWQFFPFAVRVTTTPTPEWHLATFFYESAWNVAGFIALWATRRRMKRRGDVFWWYLAIYGAGRSVIEGLRTDSLMLLGLRVSQWLSVAMMLCAAGVFLARVARQGAGGAGGAVSSGSAASDGSAVSRGAASAGSRRGARGDHPIAARVCLLGAALVAAAGFIARQAFARKYAAAGFCGTVTGALLAGTVAAALLLVCVGLYLMIRRETPEQWCDSDTGASPEKERNDA